jgi:hypothetical protein
MTDFGAELLAKLRTVDTRMVAAGSYPISPRWWQVLERFYTSGKRVLTIRKGRQVYASKGICPRLVVATMLCARPVPPGEVRSFAVLSVRRSEALDRLDNIAGVLATMKIPHQRAGEAIQVPAMRSRVVVQTASYKTAVGDTCDLIWADELTRWHDESTSANPAAHVIASIKPSLVTLPNAKLFQVSSPWTVGDYHDRQIALGDNDSQNVEIFATWEAAPHLTETDCRNMASSPSEFSREYGAIPNDGTTGEQWLNSASIAASVDQTRALDLPHNHRWKYAAGGDFGFTRNASAIVVVGHKPEDPQVHVAATLELKPEPGQPLNTALVATLFGTVLARYALRTLYVDHHAFVPMQERAGDAGYMLEAVAEGNAAKTERWLLMRSALHEDRLVLPPDPNLVKQLHGVTCKLQAGGTMSIDPKQERDGSHGDTVAALVLAIHAMKHARGGKRIYGRTFEARQCGSRY